MKGMTFEERLSSNLKKNYKLRMDIANFATGFIPKYILLDRTRNIHSYMLFCEIKGEKVCCSYWNQNNMKESVMEFLKLQYSSLDRPLFLVLQDNKNNIHMLESTIIREQLLDNPSTDLNKFIISEAVEISDILPRIYKEL